MMLTIAMEPINLMVIVIMLSVIRCQFHQHFMSSFYTKILSPKISNPNCKHIKVKQKTLYEKAAHKILVKLTQDGCLSSECRGAVKKLFRQEPIFVFTWTNELLLMGFRGTKLIIKF